MAGRNHAVRKVIRGVDHKLCTGPLHTDGKFVPISQFYKDKRGYLRSWCKACDFSIKNSEPTVPITTVKFALDELIYRLGFMEATRRLGISSNALSSWKSGRATKLKKKNAVKIVQALAEVRANGEVRHRKSIRHGAAQRGHAERVPSARDDFNGPNNKNAETKRRNRVSSGKLDEIRAKDRDRKRRKPREKLQAVA